MIRVTDASGRTHYLAAHAIDAIQPVGQSSRWGGINALVRMTGGQVVESSQAPDELAAMVETELQATDQLVEE